MINGTYVGTSGWQSQAFVGHFYPVEIPSAGRLAFYANELNAVELNSTFYRFSRPETFAKRHAETPAHFKFAVKANRYFTHDNPLRDPEGRWPKFFEPVKQLKEKLGPILFQFPASYALALDDLEKWMKILDHGYKYAFEFRNTSWHRPSVYRVLEAYDAAFCIYDIRQFHPELIETASWGYFRFHGPLKQPYRGAYSEEALGQWAQLINQKLGFETAYAFFDNTMSAEATDNARSFRKLLAASGSPSAQQESAVSHHRTD